MFYRNREEAGKKLAAELRGKTRADALVMAIPRGGVVVGAEIAEMCRLPMDLVIPRKLGAPQNPEVALGAVAQDGTLVLNEKLLALLGLAADDLKPLVEKEVREIERRMRLYRGRAAYPDYRGREIILVDDGIATGYTVLAALRFIKKHLRAGRLILAVPVAPAEAVAELRPEVDELLCPLAAGDFQAVGQFYLDFSQTEDRQVIDKLEKYREGD